MSTLEFTENGPAPVDVDMSCPKCGQQFTKKLWLAVMSFGDPISTIDRVARDATITCPHCGHIQENNQPVTYVDPEHDTVIYLMPNAHEADHMCELLAKSTDCPGPTSGDKLKERVVIGLTNLYGAALAASEGLDDRVIEIAKIDILSRLCPEDEKVYSCVLSSVHKDKLSFAVETNKRSFGFDAVMELYEVRRRMLMRSSLANLENYMIDLDWGRYGHMVLKREFENTD